jgi:perosamine synthetase
VRPADRDGLASAVERLWSPEGDALACLSARSAFDLVLSALDLPRGGEVLLSAVTVPYIPEIVRGHGLVPVPVDLEPATLAPRADLLERLRTGRTVAVLVAHLFGGRFDVGPVAGFCSRHRLPLLEDCAQSFLGREDTGSPSALASFFSFGPIKTSTALGGGLVRVRSAEVLGRMRALHGAWPVQTRAAFGRRVARMGALAVLQRPLPYRLVAAASGPRLDEVVGGTARSFRGGQAFRRQPSSPLLALLLRRLSHGDGARLRARAGRGELVARALADAYHVPGRAQDRRTHWLFPITVDDAQALVDRLRDEGFDASRATSALVAVPAPPGRPEADPVAARRMLERIVFLPVYPELPDRALRRLLQTMISSHWATATSRPAATATRAGVGAAGPPRSSRAVLPPPGIDAGSVS